jgi:hypothetical protein
MADDALPLKALVRSEASYFTTFTACPGFGSAPPPYTPFFSFSCASALAAGNGDDFASSLKPPRG